MSFQRSSKEDEGESRPL